MTNLEQEIAEQLRDNLLSADVSSVNENYKNWRSKYTVGQLIALTRVCDN